MSIEEYLMRLAQRDGDEDIRRHLERRFRPGWRRSSEWRISTETEESIERRGDVWEVRSTCDFQFIARVADIESALTARGLLYSLHVDLFYGLGWPSWAGYMQMQPDAPPKEPLASDAHPYLKKLYDRSIERYAPLTSEIEATIDSAGAWCDRANGVKRITIEEEYPEIPREATEPILPELWFLCELERSAIKVSWRSPTVPRAIVFIGIVEALTSDIEKTFGWR